MPALTLSLTAVYQSTELALFDYKQNGIYQIQFSASVCFFGNAHGTELSIASTAYMLSGFSPQCLVLQMTSNVPATLKEKALQKEKSSE